MSKVVRFRKCYLSYQPGETAGFDAAQANRLVASGHAVLEADHQAAVAKAETDAAAAAEAAAKAKEEADAAAAAEAEAKAKEEAVAAAAAEAEAKAKEEADAAETKPAAAKKGKT